MNGCDDSLTCETNRGRLSRQEDPQVFQSFPSQLSVFVALWLVIPQTTVIWKIEINKMLKILSCILFALLNNCSSKKSFTVLCYNLYSSLLTTSCKGKKKLKEEIVKFQTWSSMKWFCFFWVCQMKCAVFWKTLALNRNRNECQSQWNAYNVQPMTDCNTQYLCLKKILYFKILYSHKFIGLE